MQETLANGKIGYLEIPAQDIARSSWFYGTVFGWRLRRRAGGPKKGAGGRPRNEFRQAMRGAASLSPRCPPEHQAHAPTTSTTARQGRQPKCWHGNG